MFWSRCHLKYYLVNFHLLRPKLEVLRQFAVFEDNLSNNDFMSQVTS